MIQGVTVLGERKYRQKIAFATVAPRSVPHRHPVPREVSIAERTPGRGMIRAHLHVRYLHAPGKADEFAQAVFVRYR